MKNTKNLYISCKWFYDYITNCEYFSNLMEHKLLNLTRMFKNNTSFPCSQNEFGKNNQMCMYVCGQKIENYFAQYILTKIENLKDLNVKELPNVCPDFIFCEYCDRYHDTIKERIDKKTLNLKFCPKCFLFTCNWNSHSNDDNTDVNYWKFYYKMGPERLPSKEYCGSCNEIESEKCTCGENVLKTKQFFCSSKECWKLQCDYWRCVKCFESSTTRCACCTLHFCNECITQNLHPFTKVEGLIIPIGSKVCKHCISSKIKQCKKCNLWATGNILWECKLCSGPFHKQCFDNRTKCTLCKSGTKMPLEHVRKCGENICENCFVQEYKKCTFCDKKYEKYDCLLCLRDIKHERDKIACNAMRNLFCKQCLGAK